MSVLASNSAQESTLALLDDDEAQRMKEALTNKQRHWYEHFVLSLNATEAARVAKYKGGPATWKQIGHKNLRHPTIARLVEDVFTRRGMSKEELFARLAVLARSDMVNFATLNDEGRWVLDLAKGIEAGFGQQLREVTETRDRVRRTITRFEHQLDDDGNPVEVDGRPVLVEVVEVIETEQITTKAKTHNPIPAKIALMRAYGLFKDPQQPILVNQNNYFMKIDNALFGG